MCELGITCGDWLAILMMAEGAASNICFQSYNSRLEEGIQKNKNRTQGVAPSKEGFYSFKNIVHNNIKEKK